MVLKRKEMELLMPPPTYHPQSPCMTMCFYYGGYFRHSTSHCTNAAYIGGHVMKKHYVDGKTVTIADLNNMCGTIDGLGAQKRFYIMLKNGFKLLFSDSDLVENCKKYVGKRTEMAIYVEAEYINSLSQVYENFDADAALEEVLRAVKLSVGTEEESSEDEDYECDSESSDDDDAMFEKHVDSSVTDTGMGLYSPEVDQYMILKDVQSSKAVLSTKDELPEFDQGNDLFYAHADGDSQNAPLSCQNKKIYTENLMEESNFETPIVRNQDSSAINGQRAYLDAPPLESSACGTCGTDTLSKNGDRYFWSSEDQPYAPYTSGFKSFPCDDYVMDEKVSPVMDLVRNKFGQGSAKYEFGNGFQVRDHVNFKNKIEPITSNDIVSRASEAINHVIGRTHYTECIKWPLSNSLCPFSRHNYVSRVKDEKEDNFFESRNVPPFGLAGKTSMQNSALVAHDRHPFPEFQDQPAILPHQSIKAEVNYQMWEHEMPKFNDSHLSKITQNNTLIHSDDDDSHLCILDDTSAPARPNCISMNPKPVAAPQVTSKDNDNGIVASHTRLEPNDERVIFQAALEDLSQPKSEATPPVGFLSVPLLKHQRIALSWMANKETKGACCSGGILADDQGLGKTISTIALILKERSPSETPKVKAIQSAEMLNLDEDDVNDDNTSLQAKDRPSGGTLIVCPTSVLRQWYEELHNKVTRKADLSVLVYHGSNRTKGPAELAKYDVVVTTYAIVSKTRRKQPVFNENDDQILFKDFSSCKKRKLLETDNISDPLAKVGWFRVVLDEAQCIKNHRTQVARACWGLDAKRKWCLSGTPIQNAIDDLYSYFRFLRHEPYAVFKTFYEQLKVPILCCPENGYKKLQAVLKTIMLRRTKGTLLDGEPIINLPPKTIELKKIDFSNEERDFYCRLENETRAQFAEFAKAGTVKQNYVNILVMLLRLRQACDHPLLVKGFNSNSKMSSSIEMAKKLSREKQISLLNCLEASLTICGICSDHPADAVITVCGQVFCNQCICEHVIGDDSECPTMKCKVHLSISCVFSMTTLRIALSDPPTKENTTKCSVSEVAEVSEPHSLRCPQDSSKIKATLDILLSLSKQDCIEGSMGEKAIVFSQWTGMLDLLETCLKASLIQYRRLDGKMPVAARDRAVKDFNNLPQVSVMIMSLKAASLGLNMVAASNVLLLDLWWNPTTEDQAIDRAHRIGQKRPVSVYRLAVKDTVEDRILALQQKKREMVASAFGEDETGSRQTRLTVEDLIYLFRI